MHDDIRSLQHGFSPDRDRHEAPPGSDRWLSRREFVEWSAALAALLSGGCVRPSPASLPYARAPEHAVPGQPRFFATTATARGFGLGLVVESHLGRPTKIEGNERHPASLGATDAATQAEVLTLYDPDRAKAPRRKEEVSSWSAFANELGVVLRRLAPRGGRGLTIVTGPVGSPLDRALLDEVERRFPEARVLSYDPLVSGEAHRGLLALFGRPLVPRHRFGAARCVLSLDADFLVEGAEAVRASRDFMERRRAETPDDRRNRLWMAQSRPSNTGAIADSRMIVRAGEIGAVLDAVARAAGLALPVAPRTLPEVTSRWATRAGRDLASAGSEALVVVDESQPAHVHALAHALNARLGAVGRTVEYAAPVVGRSASFAKDLVEAAAAMREGRVEALLVLGGNPSYDAPPEARFTEAMEKVPFTARLGLYDDETARAALWRLPEKHFLEQWGDARAFDGTVSFVQPLVEPLYDTRSAAEVLSTVLGPSARSDRDLLREHWRGAWGSEFERRFRKALHDGVVDGSGTRAETPTPAPTARWYRPPERDAAAYEVQFRPDVYLGDGSRAPNAWLQELPRPMTDLVWGNAAIVAPALAEKLGGDGAFVDVTVRGRTVEAPLVAVPGCAPGTVMLTLGYGRWRAGRVGTGVGYDAFRVRSAEAPFVDGTAAVAPRPTPSPQTPPPAVRSHRSMEGRDLAKIGDLATYRDDRHFVDGPKERAKRPPEWSRPAVPSDTAAYAWGMTIDLGACTGCHACVVACQAENNIPTVGRDEAARGRAMHWIRVDRYFLNDGQSPEAAFQPLPCMHCETAPCEYVCPVEATQHSSEGLNEMIYNRCIGTRYCSNNCPYKVRRFNFFHYAQIHAPSLELLPNPDVTVRSRGVMEKCTYCVQRIERARSDAEHEGHAIAAGAIRTACQQACPSGAIAFGNLKNPEETVAKRRAHPLNYALLEELNTRPRTTYLAAVRNRPDDASGAKKGEP